MPRGCSQRRRANSRRGVTVESRADRRDRPPRPPESPRGDWRVAACRLSRSTHLDCRTCATSGARLGVHLVDRGLLAAKRPAPTRSPDILDAIDRAIAEAMHAEPSSSRHQHTLAVLALARSGLPRGVHEIVKSTRPIRDVVEGRAASSTSWCDRFRQDEPGGARAVLCRAAVFRASEGHRSRSVRAVQAARAYRSKSRFLRRRRAVADA